jgi:hypothetical protein
VDVVGLNSVFTVKSVLDVPSPHIIVLVCFHAVRLESLEKLHRHAHALHSLLIFLLLGVAAAEIRCALNIGLDRRMRQDLITSITASNRSLCRSK